MGWEETLWDELSALPDTEQIVVTGSIITKLVQEILPALGRYRRTKVLAVLSLPDWDATKLAESIGSRRNTITRLAEEGRAYARESRERESWPEVTEPGTVGPAGEPVS